MQVIKNVAGKAKDTVTTAADKTVGVFKKDKPEEEHGDDDEHSPSPAKAGGDTNAEGAKTAEAGGDADNAKKDKEAATVCQFKRGDYMIHVMISQCKNIKIDAEDKCKPVVQVSCLGEKKYTSALTDIGNMDIASWDEHIFFEPKNKETDELEQGKLEVRLFDKGFLKDRVLGIYEFDMTYLYQQANHALLHKWVILTNPESKDFGETTGQLKLSITMTGEGDKQVAIEEDPNPEKEDIISPPQIKPKFYQLRFRFFMAQNIVPCDVKAIRDSSTDFKILFEYKSTKIKTKPVLVKENASEWIMWEILVPAQIPLLGGRMIFKIVDDNDVLKDELIGCIHFEQKDLLPDANGKLGRLQNKWDWKQIYGAPMGVSGKTTQRMNNNPELASLWKGRVLVHTTAEETEKPKLIARKIKAEQRAEAEKYIKNRVFSTKVYVSDVVNTPEKNKKYKVEVRIGDVKFKSEEPNSLKAKHNRFNQILKLENAPKDNPDLCEWTAPYQSIEDIGTIFIYLRYDGKRICFWKGPITQFTDPNAELKWIDFEPDLAIGKVKEHYRAGTVGIRISVHDVTANGPADWSKSAFWGKKLQKRASCFKIRIFCWQARDLPAADESGASDPFLQISDSERVQNTSIIYDSVNPIFFECIETLYEANKMEELPPCIIDCFDHDDDLIGSSVDYLARCTVDLQHEKLGVKNEIPDPKWYPCYFKKGGPKSGELLLSFSVNDLDFKDFTYKNPVDVSQEMISKVTIDEYKVSMNILGMRSLMSAGLLPVKKAFVLFNLKSMVPPMLGDSLSNIKTDPRMAGPNPTINTLLEFNIPLPRDLLFCPRMTCTVYDSVVMGVRQPILGTFIVALGQLMLDLQAERASETKDLRDVVEAVQKFVRGEALAASMRQRLKTAMEEQTQQMETQLIQRRETLRQTPRNQMTEERVPLLEAGADEEARQSNRVAEANQAVVDGAVVRLDFDQITEIRLDESRDSATSLLPTDPLRQLEDINTKSLIEEEKQFISYKEQMRIMAEQAEKNARNKRQVDELTAKALQEYKKTENVVMPEYKFDEEMKVDREVNQPPIELYRGLGWDKDKDTKRKHYRRYYQDELENVKELIPRPTPFNSYEIVRGQTRGAKVNAWKRVTGNFATDQSGNVSTEKRVGKFKAVIEVESRKARKEYLAEKNKLLGELVEGLKALARNRDIKDFNLDLHLLETQEGRFELKNRLEPLGVNQLNVIRKLAAIQSDSLLQKALLNPKKQIVRVYMIEGFNFASRDLGGQSDPYLILSIGKKKFDERKNYQLNEPNPTFYKKFDFESTFPGCPELRIDAMDHDFLFGDDLIGTNYLDLEDRFFTPEWRAIKNKPIEYRVLHHPSSMVAQGTMRMWVEINPADVHPDKKPVEYDISPKPPKKMVVRVCIFKTLDIKMCDAEGTSDVYFRCFFDAKKDALETDTHYRCQTGEASFNYRLNFHITTPRPHYRLTVQAYDRDFFKSNDIIGSNFIDLTKAIEDADLTDRPLEITESYYLKNMKKPEDKPYKFKYGDYEQTTGFWVPMRSREKDKKTNTEVVKDNGQVFMRIDITTEEHFNKVKIGSARDEPNMEPRLMPTVGRLHFTLNPFEMYKQLIGPAMRAKIARYCMIFFGSILCALILYYLVPVVIGDLISNWISSGL